MLTQCPQCRTLFPLGTEELTQDKGRVRCSRCRSVFYALEHLYRQDELQPEGPISPPELKEVVAPPAEGPVLPDVTQANVALPTEEDEALMERLRTRAPQGSRIWPLLAVVLLLGALAQWAWLERVYLSRMPQLQPWVEQACAHLPCRLPPQRDLERIEVLQRRMGRPEEEPQALDFSMILVNRAAFAQPYPHLRLELFDRENRPAGQRVFAPQEYLGSSPAALLLPNRPTYIRLRLHDPEDRFSGFEFRFL